MHSYLMYYSILLRDARVHIEELYDLLKNTLNVLCQPNQNFIESEKTFLEFVLALIEQIGKSWNFVKL